MDLSTIKIKKELDDLPEDNPDLVDVKDIRSLTVDSSESCFSNTNSEFDAVNVKTEPEEEQDEKSCVVNYNSFVAINDENGVSCSTEIKVKPKRIRKKIDIKCEQCGVMCKGRIGYKLHLMDHTGERPFKCNLCEKTYKKAMDLTYHMISHTGNHSHHCETCGKAFAVKSALRAHLRTHTKDKPYVCPVCGKGFSHSSSLKPHIAIHSDVCPFHCDRCDRKFKTKKSLVYHTQTHDLVEGKGVQCGICFKYYKSKESIKIHLKTHRPEDKARNQQLYSCEQCGSTYKHLISLKNHMRYHTNEMFECHLCDKTYVDKNHLRIHLRNHTGETPYTCDICNRNFRRRDSYVYHRTTHDTNRTTLKCDLCDKLFVCKSSLRAHQTFAHSTERRHQCPVCDKRYKMRYELTKHLRNKHEKEEVVDTKDAVRSAGTDPTQTACEVCQEDCGEEGLEAHMAKHEVKPVTYECNELLYADDSKEGETVKDEVEQVFVKQESIDSDESVKKECVD